MSDARSFATLSACQRLQNILQRRNSKSRVTPAVARIYRTLVLPTDHSGVPLFMALDDNLAAALKSGAIKLVRADFIQQSSMPHLLRRQDLEALERDRQIAVFLKPDDAVDLLRSNSRAIAALSYGWVTPDHPDVTDEYLAAIRRFLDHPLGAHVVGLFWDFGSLPQKPRSEAEKKIFDEALGCMGDVYASPLGTTVLRHRTIPKRPEGHEGVYNDRPYENRGWTCFESGVSGEAIAQAQHFKGLDAVLKRLPPKVIEIDGDGPRVADADEAGSSDEGTGPRIERVRASLKAATFTGKGDEEVVMRLYNDYFAKISRAVTYSGEKEDFVYEGEYNAANQREGFGTCRYVRGRVYEGQWKDDMQEGRGKIKYAEGDVIEGEFKANMVDGSGTYRWKDGRVYEGEFKADKMDGRCTYRLPNGTVFEGEFNADAPHGHGTIRFADGGVFEGECKGKVDGPGTFKAADGTTVVGVFKEAAVGIFMMSGGSINKDFLVGEGVKWSADGQTAWRLKDGEEVEEISLEEARRVVSEHGLSLPGAG